MCDFVKAAQTIFKINGVRYIMCNHIIKTMSIFNVLKDCESDSVLDIEWNVLPEIVNMAFHIINERNYDVLLHVSDVKNVETIAFMKYLGAPEAIICETINEVLDEDVVNYIDTCSQLPIDDNIVHIYDCYDNWKLMVGRSNKGIKDTFKGLLDKIISPHFPIKFQEKVIRKTIFDNIITNRVMIKVSMVNMLIHNSCDVFDCLEAAPALEDLVDQYFEKLKREKKSMNDNTFLQIIADHLTGVLLLRNDANAVRKIERCAELPPVLCVNDFCEKKQKTFVINGMEYVTYDHVFNSLKIFSTTTNINWDIDVTTLNAILRAVINCNFELIICDNFSACLDAIEFVRYLAPPKCLIKKLLRHIVVNDELTLFVDVCASIQYRDSMKYVLNCRKAWILTKWTVSDNDNIEKHRKKFSLLCDKLNPKHFPRDFAYDVLVKAMDAGPYFMAHYCNAERIRDSIEKYQEHYCANSGVPSVKNHVMNYVLEKYGDRRVYTDYSDEIVYKIKCEMVTALLAKIYA